MKNSKIFKLVTIGFVVISLTACGSDKISNTTNEPSTYESTVIETEATPEESEATTIEPVTTVEATTIESASVVDGDIVIDTESDGIEITETETGEKIATITTADGNTTQVVVTENESGETIVDTTKTVTESGKVTNNTKENKTEIKVDDNGNVTVETTTTIIPEPTVTPTKPANKPSETTSTEPSTTETPTTVAPTTVAPTEIPTSAEHTTTVETTASHSHSYTKTLTKAATCESDGYYTYKCSCGDSYIETIKATGHNFGSWSTTKEATCTESGVKTRKCSNCSKTETQNITATGHNYGSWTTTKSATCCENGTKTRTCSKCNNSETQTIPATGHNWTSKKIHHDEVGHYENEYKDWKEYIYMTNQYFGGHYEDCPNYNVSYTGKKGGISSAGGTWLPYLVDWYASKNGESIYDYAVLMHEEQEDNGYSLNGKHIALYTGNVLKFYDLTLPNNMPLESSCWRITNNNPYVPNLTYDLWETINHHDLVGQTWIVDTAAYDETIYTCSVCGATK